MSGCNKQRVKIVSHPQSVYEIAILRPYPSPPPCSASLPRILRHYSIRHSRKIHCRCLIFQKRTPDVVESKAQIPICPLPKPHHFLSRTRTWNGWGICQRVFGNQFVTSAPRAPGKLGSIPGSGRYPGVGWQPTPYSWLENSEDREAWWAIVHRVSNSQT